MPVEPSPTKWSFWTLTWSALISWITNDMVTKANHKCKKVCFTLEKKVLKSITIETQALTYGLVFIDKG